MPSLSQPYPPVPGTNPNGTAVNLPLSGPGDPFNPTATSMTSSAGMPAGQQNMMGTGGPLPPQQGVPGPTPYYGGTNPSYNGAPQPMPGGFAPANVVQNTVNSMMNGVYGQNARDRGTELANARGMLNSSISSGASERAALEGVQPFVQQAMGLQGQREQNAFLGEQQNLDRNLKSKLQSDGAFQQDWLNGRQYTRQFNGQLSLVPIESSAQFSQMIAKYAMDNPEVYTPQIVSGMSDFFNNNLLNTLNKYFPNGGSN